MAMCRQCGREFVAGDGDQSHICPTCAGVPDQPEQKLSNADARAILMAVLIRITSSVFVTYALFAVNVLVFLAMVVGGVSLGSPTGADLLKWGATYGPYTMNGGWWRLLSATFVHAGIIHLAFNMFVLLDLGVVAERLFGNWRFLLLYPVLQKSEPGKIYPRLEMGAQPHMIKYPGMCGGFARVRTRSLGLQLGGNLPLGLPG